MTYTDREDNCNREQKKEGKRQETPIPLILKKFMENEYSSDLQYRFTEWLEQNKHQHEVTEYLRKEFDAIPIISAQDDKERAITEQKLLKLKNVINQIAQEDIFPEANEARTATTKRPTLSIPVARWIMRAAAVLIPVTIALGTYLVTLKDETTINQNTLLAVSQTEIVAPKGSQKEETLPEGSKVWLNAGSQITYTDDPQNKQRKAQLTGEAYFSVTKDPEKPFIVETDDLTLKVLGTQFNVKAYPNEDKTVVTLDEGKVEIRIKSNELYTLTPNQQLIFDKKTGETKILITTAGEPNWKNGQLIFDDLTFQEILHAMERHYNLTMVVDPAVITNKKYSVKFGQSDNITDAMQIMQTMIQGFTYKIEENKVIIKKV